MRIRIWALAAGAALALTACSTGSSSNSDNDAGDAGSGVNAQAAGAGAGVPEVVQPVEVRKLVRENMAGKRIAFVPLLYKGFKITTEWGIQMERVFNSMGAEFSVYDANFDTDQMVRIVDDLIKSGDTDVLILHNPDLNVLSKSIRDAQNAGIYVVVLNMISNQSGDAFIGADLVGMGEAITERAAADCKAAGKTDIALINGPATDPWNVLFAEGVGKAAKRTGLRIVDTTDSQWQADLASQQAATLLERNGGNLCALLVPWDVIALPAATALQNAEREGRVADGQVGVYAIDASIDGCKGIRDGLIKATIAYDQSGIGSGAAIAVQQLLQLQRVPGSQRTVAYVPYVLIDEKNMDQVTFACYQGS